MKSTYRLPYLSLRWTNLSKNWILWIVLSTLLADYPFISKSAPQREQTDESRIKMQENRPGNSKFKGSFQVEFSLCSAQRLTTIALDRENTWHQQKRAQGELADQGSSLRIETDDPLLFDRLSDFYLHGSMCLPWSPLFCWYLRTLAPRLLMSFLRLLSDVKNY